MRSLSLSVLSFALVAMFSAAASAQLPVWPPVELAGISVATPKPAATPAQSATQSVSAPRNQQSVAISPTTILTPTDQIASSVTVITAQDIDNEQRRTAPDVLSTVPGIN